MMVPNFFYPKGLSEEQGKGQRTEESDFGAWGPKSEGTIYQEQDVALEQDSSVHNPCSF